MDNDKQCKWCGRVRDLHYDFGKMWCEESRVGHQFECEEAPQAATGKCTECGGDVFHRRGKPGEFDHDCRVEGEAAPAPQAATPNTATDNLRSNPYEIYEADLQAEAPRSQPPNPKIPYNAEMDRLLTEIANGVAESRPSAEEVARLIVNLMNASRAAGYCRGQKLDDTEANRDEDKAVENLREWMQERITRP